MTKKSTHRVFYCRSCGRVVTGCTHPGAVPELVECCAYCTAESRKPARKQTAKKP